MHALLPHPASPAPAGLGLSVDVAREAGALHLDFRLRGALAQLLLPAAVAQPGFRDGLWQHTCFEAFIAGTEGSAYREFNFSPAGDWAAYTFSDYRQRDAGWQPEGWPEMALTHVADGLHLAVRMPAALIPADAACLGLSAVIETAEGALSYWALTHAAERPDFHQRASFSLRLDRA